MEDRIVRAGLQLSRITSVATSWLPITATSTTATLHRRNTIGSVRYAVVDLMYKCLRPINGSVLRHISSSFRFCAYVQRSDSARSVQSAKLSHGLGRYVRCRRWMETPYGGVQMHACTAMFGGGRGRGERGEKDAVRLIDAFACTRQHLHRLEPICCHPSPSPSYTNDMAPTTTPLTHSAHSTAAH